MIEGRLEALATTSMNSVKGTAEGLINFHFGEEVVTMSNCYAKISSLMSSKKRNFKYDGSCELIDKSNGLYGKMIFDPDNVGGMKSFFTTSPTPEDYIEGIITHSKDLDYLKLRSDKQNIKKLRAEGTIITQLSGSWLKNIYFDDKLFWELKDFIPFKLVGSKNSLPSDASKREDLH